MKFCAQGIYCASFVLASSILSIEMYKCIEEFNPTYLNNLQYKPVIINFVTQIDWSSKIHVPYSNKVIFDVIFYQTILKSELESVSVYTYLMSRLLSYDFILCWHVGICIPECAYVYVRPVCAYVYVLCIVGQ